MKNEFILDCFEKTCNNIKKEFTEYMFGEDFGEEYGEWIANDPSGVADFGEGSYFFHLSDMYDVLKHQYKPTIVTAHYEYSVAYRGDENEYGINLENFSQIYDGSNIDEWAKMYHADRDKNRMFWESDIGRKKTEDDMKILTEKFKKDIANIKKNEITS